MKFKKYQNGGPTDSLKIIKREGKLAVKTEKQKQASAKKQATLAKKIAKAKENARLNLEWQKMSKEQKDSLYMEELKDRRKRFKEGGAIKKMQIGGSVQCPEGYHYLNGECVKNGGPFSSLGAKLGFFGPIGVAAGVATTKAIINRNKNKVKRLEKREDSLVKRGNKAVDEGREKKADRLLGRAAKVENRVITEKEKKAAKKNVGNKKLPKAQLGAIVKGVSKVVKPVAKTKKQILMQKIKS